jgi:hypothetical protein
MTSRTGQEKSNTLQQSMRSRSISFDGRASNFLHIWNRTGNEVGGIFIM